MNEKSQSDADNLEQLKNALNKFIAALTELVEKIKPTIDALVKICNRLQDKLPNKRIVYLAYYHKKERIRKKNQKRILEYWRKCEKWQELKRK